MSIGRLTMIATTVVMMATAAAAQVAVRVTDTAPRSVTLPLAEYNRLLDLGDRTAAPALQPAAPPAALNSADLRIRVDAQTARGQFTVSGAAYSDGIQKVSLISGANVLNATLNGRPLPLVVEGQTHAALLQGAGPFTATLDWGTSLVFQPGRASFLVPVPQAGTARATIDIPGDQADVRIPTGLITQRTVSNGRTLIDVTLRPGLPAEVSWTMRDSAPAAAAKDARALADVFTLVSLGDADIRMAALIDIAVVQGEPRTFEARLPAGYEVTSITGNSLDRSDERGNTVVLTVSDPSLRQHQFLIGLERAHDAGSFVADTEVLTIPAMQRERGEIAIEGDGALDLTADEREPLHRIDVRELNPALQQMAHSPLLSAFRYQRVGGAPRLSLDVKRFEDAGVLAAVAEFGTATTMVTVEGRALTEISLLVRNRAQPFLRLSLPDGATIASVDVAGQPAKPVLGADGIRIPLLRPGFRPDGAYTVSFVYMHAGTPFARSGQMAMILPRMDVPVALLQWEVFLPEQYSVRTVDGNVIDQQKYVTARVPRVSTMALTAQRANPGDVTRGPGLPGQVRGVVKDISGAVLPGVTVQVEVNGFAMAAVSGRDGSYVLSGVPSGPARITSTLAGFTTTIVEFMFDQQPREYNPTMRVGSLEETITVSGDAPGKPQFFPPSENVLNLQRRVAGVLPIRVDVPHAGTSHQFVRALVIEEETMLTLKYRRQGVR